jgi:hypothetical protein
MDGQHPATASEHGAVNTGRPYLAFAGIRAGPPMLGFLRRDGGESLDLNAGLLFNKVKSYARMAGASPSSFSQLLTTK